MSRVLHLPWVVALGLAATVGLGVFTLLGEFVSLTARRIGPAYLVLALVSAPFILTFLERAISVPGAGGAYQLARTNRFLWHRFFSGWLLLGGYAVLVALLSWGISFYLETLYLATGFELSFDRVWLAALGLAGIMIYTLLKKRINWSRRFVITAAGVGILLLVVLLGIVFPASSVQSARPLPSSLLILETVTLMTSCLWGLYLVLSTRAQLQRPMANMRWALTLPVIGLGLLGSFAGLAVNLYNGALLHPTLPLVDVLGSIDILSGDLTLLFYLLSGLAITCIAGERAMAAGAQLLDSMSRDGFVPNVMQYLPELDNPALPAILLGAALSLGLIIFAPFRTLIGLAAISFLWSAAFIHLPDLFSASPNLPPKRPVVLPFHPLFPGLTVAVGLLMPFNLSTTVWLIATGWLAIGGIYYIVHARATGQSLRRQQVVVDEEDFVPLPASVLPEPNAAQANVIVGIGNSQSNGSLLRLASKLAISTGGDVVALKIVDLPEYGNQAGWQKVAYVEWKALADELAEHDYGASIRPTVRLAPSFTDGLIEAIHDERAGWLVLGWPGTGQQEDGDQAINLGQEQADSEPAIDELVAYAECNVAVLRGVLPDEIQQIVVATGGGTSAVSGLELAGNVLDEEDGKIHLITVARGTASSEQTAKAEDLLERTVAAAEISDASAVVTQVVNAPAVAGGVANRFRDADLLIVGASKNQMPERAHFGGLARELLEHEDRTGLLVRNVEPVRFPALRRAIDRFADRLPTLTPERRETVLRQMRTGAVPSIDFFVLIFLSSTIASLGLLQNSGAVIIGAMLVAPLMSPILSMGMGMAVGESATVRLGLEATLKGMTTAIVVGAVVVIISPIDAPTNEILARTSPNVLDLMVALASGAAAGYAVSRKEVAAALPGVAIAAALVPPLCVVGYGIGVSQLDIAVGALLLFLTNLTAIVFAAALTFLILGFHPPHFESGQMLRSMRSTIISLLIIVVVLTVATWITVSQDKARVRIEETFAELLVGQSAQIIEIDVARERGYHRIVAMALAYPGSDLSSEGLASLEADLEEAVGGAVEIDITVLPAWRDDLANVEQRATLMDMFDAAILDRGGEAQTTTAAYSAGRYRLSSTVYVYDGHSLSEGFLDDLRAEMREAVGAPVTIDATFLEAFNIESVEPTATPLPTASPTATP